MRVGCKLLIVFLGIALVFINGVNARSFVSKIEINNDDLNQLSFKIKIPRKPSKLFVEFGIYGDQESKSHRCPHIVNWSVEKENLADDSRVIIIRYGDVPDGFREIFEKKELVLGCIYQASFVMPGASGGIRFMVIRDQGMLKAVRL